MKVLKILFYFFLLNFCAQANAQFLPNNTNLNVHSVQLWMKSNKEFSALVEAVDSMHQSDAAMQAFDLLSAAQQDLKINTFLQKKKLLDSANRIAAQHGWKSVGEYMRLSTKLGNAIAAYFLANEIANLQPEQKKIVLAKADPSVLAVPMSDIVFIKMHETLLKNYIQAYSQGR